MARLGNLLALLSAALLATESHAAKRTFAKKKGKTALISSGEISASRGAAAP